MPPQRPTLLEMLRADPLLVTDPFLLYPFPGLVAGDSKVKNGERSGDSEDAGSEADSVDSRDDPDLKNAELAGLESCKWTQEELRKWVEARRQRFPVPGNKTANEKLREENLSNFEKKLRLKVMILSDDPIQRKRIQKSKKFLFRTATVSSNRWLRPKKVREREAGKEGGSGETGETAAPLERPSTAPMEPPAVDGKTPKQTKMEALSPEDIIAHLKQRKTEDTQSFGQYFEQTPQNFGYNFKQNTLFVSLVMDQILAERNTILDLVTYLVDHNFLQPSTAPSQSQAGLPPQPN